MGQRPKLIKLTFLDKESKLIGAPWQKSRRWINAEHINFVMFSEEQKHTALLMNGNPYLVEESMDLVAALINGDKSLVYDFTEKEDVQDEDGV